MVVSSLIVNQHIGQFCFFFLIFFNEWLFRNYLFIFILEFWQFCNIFFAAALDFLHQFFIFVRFSCCLHIKTIDLSILIDIELQNRKKQTFFVLYSLTIRLIANRHGLEPHHVYSSDNRSSAPRFKTRLGLYICFN